MTTSTRNFWEKQFRDYHFALGYADAVSGLAKRDIPKSRQSKYNAGYELGLKDKGG